MEQRLYELLRQCTVRISVPEKTGHGTGFFVTPGLILTCAHVIKAAQSDNTAIELYWNGQTHTALVTTRRDDLDLALLQVNVSGQPCVYLHEEVALRELLCSYGYPDNYPNGDTITGEWEGWTEDTQPLLKFKMAQVRPGMSGAPLLNERTGYVCGIVKRSSDRNSALGGRAIPTTAVFQAFPELIAQQKRFHRDDKRWFNCLPEFAARMKYLEGIISRYGSVTFPIRTAEVETVESFSLQAIFQPLALRHDPLEAELRERMNMQVLLGESVQDAESFARQPVVAENGEDALRRSPKGRIVVLGGPGTGKTTTLKFLTEDRAQKARDNIAAPVPLFISLPYLARSGKSLLDYIKDLVAEMSVDSRYADVLLKEIEVGNAFICMDGLDEVEPKQRPRMIELINNRATSAGNTWVIGSRFSEYKGGQFKHAQFAEWELLPMSHALRMELAQHLFPELQRLLPHVQQGTPLSAASFVSVLEQHPQASAWGDNPLLFSLAAMVFTQTHGLPSSRVTLYQSVIGGVIETREPDSLEGTALLRQLSNFACRLHLSKERTFSSDNLLGFFIDVKHKSEEEAARLSHRIISSGLMDVVGRETYSFRHQTFQEYLTALELAHRLTSQNPNIQKNAWDVVWSKRTYSRWTEILRLMVGILVQLGKDSSNLALSWLQSLVEQRKTEDGDPGNLGLMLALSCLVEVAALPEWSTPQTIRLGKQIVSTCIEEACIYAQHSRGDPSEQLEAVAQEMGYLPGALSSMVIEQCLTLLHGPDDGAQKVGAEILKKQRGRLPIEPLLRALKNGQEKIREAVLDVLAEQGERVPIEPLLNAMRDDSWVVCDAAARALVKQGLRVPLEALMQILFDKRSRIPYQLAHVFKAYGERLPLEPFLDCLTGDTDAAVLAREVLIDQGARVPVESWIEVIRRAGWHNYMQVSDTLSAQKESIPVDVLLNLLQDENEVARMVAAIALCDREPPAPVEKLLPALKHEDPRVRLIILEALGKRWQQVPENSLIDSLNDTNPKLVGAAIAASGNRLSQEHLSSMPESEYEEIRIGVLKALVAHGIDANVELALASLHDRSSRVRQQAVETIGLLAAQGTYVSPEWLRTVSNDVDFMVLHNVKEALVAMGERVPLEMMFEAMQGSSQINDAVIQVLASLGERIPTRTLLDTMQHDYAGIRCAAVYILGAQGKQGAVEILLPALQGKQRPAEILLAALQDKHASVRRAAVETLGRQNRLPDKALLAALRDKSTSVRRAAAQALQSLGKHAPLEGVLTALDDADKEICLIAATMCTTYKLQVPTEVLINAFPQNIMDMFMIKQDALKIALVDALALNKDQNVQDILMRILLYHSNDTVGHAAARALHKQWGPLSLDKLMQKFNTLYSSGEASQRCAAVELLGIYMEEDRVSVPIKVFRDVFVEDEDEDVYFAALLVLLAQDRSVPIDIYHELLQSRDVYTQAMMLQAFAKQGRLPLSDLLDALHSNEGLMHESIAQVIEMQGALLPVEVLLEALQHDNEKIRQAAVGVLIAQKEHIPVQSLLALLQDERRRVRTSAMEVLTAFREPMPVELLMKDFYESGPILGEEKYHIIAQAIIAQGKRLPTDSLLLGLYNGDRDVRLKVLEVLQGLKRSVPLEMLLLAVSDEDTGLVSNTFVLENQILASGESRTPMPVVGKAAQLLYDQYPKMFKQITTEATDILQGKSQDSILASITQCFVASVISQLGYPAPEFLDKLTELLDWPHWLVRLRAIGALRKLRRNVPDEAIRRLLQLRRDPDPMMSAIRQAADDALAEILSLETGIEDD